ncbi:SMP-30/gluconolactonase/LRE family protein (plasmid) [Sphingobium sp. SJ10-10]|uniref:SMP-30/gluconolactonase/LRE family protein n=1 Tax=Sphingobium sp. SJ10-10 TaxID=3114999 RepID=UPI002E195980|nr:SMP-30/gluconolactonase/LRE family protein [Sphingobium sp. SJ10-10]
MKFTELASGLAFPEGPVVMPDGSVIVTEIVSGHVTRIWGDGKRELVADTGGGPAGAALGPDGALYICNLGGFDLTTMCFGQGPGYEGRIERIDLSNGKVERLYETCGEKLLQAPDDIVFDREGNMWFTDLGKDFLNDRTYGGLYYANIEGTSISEAYGRGLSFNGVGLTSREDILYVTDTYSARVWRLELEGPGNPRPGPSGHPGHLHATIPTGGAIDSMAVLASGNICVAAIHPGGMAVVTEDGKVEMVDLPDDVVTNIAFGGSDMRDAYITLSGTGKLLHCRWPEPGLKLNFSD